MDGVMRASRLFAACAARLPMSPLQLVVVTVALQHNWQRNVRIGMKTALVLLAIAMMATQAVAGPWPDGKKVAVALTYDDTLVSQLDIAIPALDAAGLKGTFFLIGSKITPEQIARWRSAAAEGHELGNHTIRHACPQANYPPRKRSIPAKPTMSTPCWQRYAR